MRKKRRKKYIDSFLLLRHDFYMGLDVYIPVKGEGFFTLFAQGCVMGKKASRIVGTFISLKGIAVLFYTYPHCRRAYIVRNIRELRYYQAMRLPNVDQKLGILFKARGRQIDLLRKALYFLSEINGDEAYTYDTLFWQKIICLIESCKGRYSSSLKTNITALHRQYIKIIRSRHESKRML